MTDTATVTVLFTDVVGSTELKTGRGDTPAHLILQKHFDLVRQQIEKHSGQEVKTIGDSFMVSFVSARRAVDCAIAVQQAIAEHNGRNPDQQVQVRIGLNTGEAIRESGDLFGQAVDAAARIVSEAQGGKILISETTRAVLGVSKDVEFIDQGLFSLKGFPEKWRLYEVVWQREKTPAVFSPAIPQGKPLCSIAVLPFVNMSADPDQEYFCDGLSEELINALTQINDLKVIARTSAFSFRGKELDVRDIGTKLNVQTVLEGSLRKAGNRLRVTAQLIDTADGHHLWSERYDREMDDVFAIQDEITLAIVDKLKVKLLGGGKATLAKHKIVDLEAYDLYLKGRYFWNKMTEEDLKRATEYFQRAIEKAPNYAPAYAGLADSYCYLPIYGALPTTQTYPKARAAALKALEIDDALVEAYVSLGNIKTYHDWNWEGAEKEFRRAVELSPDYALGHHWYAMYLLCLARFDEAIREMRRALELDPISLVINRDLGFILSYAGQREQAMEALHRTIEIDPNFPTTHLMLAWLYFQGSNYEEAIAAFEREMAISGSKDSRTESSFAGFYALIGNKDKTQTILDDLLRRSKRAYVPAYSIASVYIALGEVEQGFEWLDKAYEERDIMLSYIKVGPEFTQRRSDPRYAALLKKMGLEQ